MLSNREWAKKFANEDADRNIESVVGLGLDQASTHVELTDHIREAVYWYWFDNKLTIFNQPGISDPQYRVLISDFARSIAK